MRYNKKIIERIKSGRAAEIWTNEVGMNKPTARAYKGIYYNYGLIAIAVFRVRRTPLPIGVSIEYKFLGFILPKRLYTKGEIDYLKRLASKWDAKWLEDRTDGVLNIQYSPREVNVIEFNLVLERYEVLSP